MNKQLTLKTTIDYALKNNQFANAYLLIGNQANQYPKKIVHYITKEDRVLSDNYQDYLAFEKDFKKEDALHLQQYFINKPVEKFNKKIYSILNIDRASTASLNALLKFLEEPISDTIAILTATQKSNVLPTILSRCNVIKLETEDKVYIEEVEETFKLCVESKDLDLMFIELHKLVKKWTYLEFYDLYELLIIHYRKLANYQYMQAFVETQHEFEKACMCGLVLDHTLYLLKKGEKL